MASLPSISGKTAIAAFGKMGFKYDRTAGSHHILKKKDFAFVLSVPVHGDKPLKRGTLRSLIRDAEISIDEFVKLLD
jgi:predicted RNA binding protein YcfA (HicA-like mRNA interferase family)